MKATIKAMAKQLNISEKLVAEIYLEGFRRGEDNFIEKDKKEELKKELTNMVYPTK